MSYESPCLGVIGNKHAQKHSDMQIAEIVAMRQKWGIGYSQIAYISGVPRTTVRYYLSGERMKSLLSSYEFNQVVDRITDAMPRNAPASRAAVERASKKAKELAAKDEKRVRLESGKIEHIPVQQVAKARAEAAQQTELARDRDAWRKEWAENLKQAGVPKGAPRHVIDRFKPDWRPER